MHFVFVFVWRWLRFNRVGQCMQTSVYVGFFAESVESAENYCKPAAAMSTWQQGWEKTWSGRTGSVWDPMQGWTTNPKPWTEWHKESSEGKKDWGNWGLVMTKTGVSAESSTASGDAWHTNGPPVQAKCDALDVGKWLCPSLTSPRSGLS